MIVFTVFKDASGTYRGFNCKGHAGYSDSGTDIVCAAVSILVINTANALEAFTDLKFSQKADAGFIEMIFDSVCTESVKLLMDTLIMGICGICDNHPKFVDIRFKEVT